LSALVWAGGNSDTPGPDRSAAGDVVGRVADDDYFAFEFPAVMRCAICPAVDVLAGSCQGSGSDVAAIEVVVSVAAKGNQCQSL